MTKIPIGWPTTPLEFEMHQGSSGVVRIAWVVVNEDDTPLPSYDGWTAEFALCRSVSSLAEIDMKPDVVGDAITTRLIVDLDFTTALTKDKYPGTLKGDLVLISPEGERQYPYNITLTINRSAAPQPGSP